MYTDCFSVCCLQRAMAAEYGSFNTQAVPASVDIMGFSCRHATDISLQRLAGSSCPFLQCTHTRLLCHSRGTAPVLAAALLYCACACETVLRGGRHDITASAWRIADS